MENRRKKSYINLLQAGYDSAEDAHPWGEGVRDCYIIHYVISGVGYYEVGGKKYRVTAGESFIILPDTRIYYYPDTADPWEYIWIDFEGSLAEELLKKCSMNQKNPVAEKCENSPLEFFKQINENLACKSDEYLYTNDALLHLILAWYAEQYPLKAEGGDTAADRAIRYIENNYHKAGMNIDFLANELSVSRVTLYRSFMRRFKLSPLEFIANMRINKACELLRGTEFSIKMIAFSVGFEDQLYFSKFFKRHTGMTPSEYRESKGAQ